MGVTAEEQRVQGKPQKDERQLLGTLLASRPPGTRSPGALALSIALHGVLLALLVLVSRPFVPGLADKFLHPITLITPEEEPPPITIQPVRTQPLAPGPVKGSPERKNRTSAASQPPALTFTPGPILPIPAPSAGEETPMPSDAGPGNGAGGGKGSLADRLRPRVIDPRITANGSYLLPPDNSPVAHVRERVAMTLQEFNDSVAAEAEAKRRAFDWTIKTKDGKQWGIGPDGKIHLGEITLPAIAFSPPDGRRDEINGRNRAFAEIESQASREIARQTFKDRVKAIRARKDRERAEKKKDGDPAPITQN